MTITVHTINHPIVHLSISYLTNITLSKRQILQEWKNIFHSLIYETVRKNIDLIKLRINCVYDYVQVSLISPNQNCSVLIEDFIYQTISDDIYSLLPHASIQSMSEIDDCKQSKFILPLSKDSLSQNSTLILLQRVLDVSIIIDLLDLRRVNSMRIQICCVVCSLGDLQLLSKYTTQVDIYTVKILNYTTVNTLKELWYI